MARDDEETARSLLMREARALLTRLSRIKPFALEEPMLPAAALSPGAQAGIERHLLRSRRDLRARVEDFLAWMEGPAARVATASEVQRRFVALRLRFNVVLAEFDVFADVITQRSEHETGVWLAGLDAVALDLLRLPGEYFEPPPLACYLDRGVGGAIRRARTRLPGGGPNPVAIIRVPRERMIGSGIASSLAHEVGHQGATLLDLTQSLRPVFQAAGRRSLQPSAWALWERWHSEILADLWAIGRVGVASTLGLISVVSLPRVFAFQLNAEDSHPFPWIRVLLSCALGDALYPHAQWAKLARIWGCLYPLGDADSSLGPIFSALRASVSELAALLIEHRPPSLGGESLAGALCDAGRSPSALAELFQRWCRAPWLAREAPPSLVFAVVGQARFDELLSPEDESRLLGEFLTGWALRGALAGANGANRDARPPTLDSLPNKQGAFT